MIFLKKEYGLLIILFANLLSYLLYYLDKKKARQRKRRISEKNLLLSTFFLGGVGAWFAMNRFRHKTEKIKFKLFVPLAAILTLVTIVFIFYK